MENIKPETIFQICLVSTLIGAAIADLRTFRIPNAVPICVMVLFVGYAISSLSGMGVLSHSISFVLAFTLGLVAFRYKIMAGGDVKLIAAIGLWFSVDQLYLLLTLIALAGGLQSVIIVAVHYISRAVQGLQTSMRGSGSGFSARHGPGLSARRVPYGVAIAGGSIVALFLTLP